MIYEVLDFRIGSRAAVPTMQPSVRPLAAATASLSFTHGGISLPGAASPLPVYASGVTVLARETVQQLLMMSIY